MNTVTLSRNQYAILKKRASLYEAILRTLPERRWGIEKYSSRRIQESMRQDRLDKKTYSRLKKLLNAKNFS